MLLKGFLMNLGEFGGVEGGGGRAMDLALPGSLPGLETNENSPYDLSNIANSCVRLWNRCNR